MIRAKLRIRRKGYFKDVKPGKGRKRSYIRPVSYMAMDRGLPGRTPKGRRWAPEAMLETGWSARLSDGDRMVRLRRAIGKYGWKRVSSHLISIHNLNMRSSPSVAKIAMADQRVLSRSFSKKRREIR